MDYKSNGTATDQVCDADMNGFSKGDGRMFLVWEDISVVLSNFGRGVASSKWLLSGLSGFAEPGRLMAIMGPSGSGKSSLLDALSGRLSSNLVMSGDVLVNGKKRRLDYGGVAYVTQEDTLLGTLTVKETLTYSANLRFPPTMTKQGINAMVEAVIIEMGLQDCADRVIGNWHLRGISGGEKKRLSIALETLTRPSLLFLDEPTSGLDSASAFFVVQTLKRIARSGRTVIASIHQPSNEVFALFDDLFLLSGGQTVYFGEASSAEEFFEWAGYPCPSWQNPSDHFLQCINSDFDDVAKTMKSSLETCIEQQPIDNLHSMATTDIKAILVEKYKTSSFRTKAKARMHEILSMKGLTEKTRNGSKATWWKQLRTLTKRSMVNMSRDLGYYWLRIAVYIILSFAVGTIFFDIGTSYMAIFGRAGCGAFISGFMTFIAIGGFPSFSEEMKVFYKERLNGHYAVTAYALSNFISSFPFLLAISLSTVLITYYMVKFQSGFERVSYACLNLTFSISVVESCMMIVASLVPNYLMGIVAGLGVIGVNTITAGYFRPLPDLPKPIWRYPLSLVSYQSWALQGAYKNDMIGLKFEPMLSNQPKLTGEYVMKFIFGIDPVRSKWWDLSIVIANLIIYKILLVIILKLKERSMPGIHNLLSKRKLKQHTREKVFIKKPSFSSQRHQVVHSLSSQEGLNSPSFLQWPRGIGSDS